jgi:hypothetical protein
MHQHPYGSAPDVARHGTCAAQADSVDVMMACGPMTWEWKAVCQYSSASMTVMTRTVTVGSVGSGEW